MQMGKESEQESQDSLVKRSTGFSVTHHEAKRYLVSSIRNPMIVQMVDLEEYDGYGECSCEYWQFVIGPQLKKGKKPLKQCRHLRIVKSIKK